MKHDESRQTAANAFNRREFVGMAVAGAVGSALPVTAESHRLDETPTSGEVMAVSMTINDEKRSLQVDSRVTLLDLLREELHLAGTKKGCDHGQCGACTVLVNGRRINSCLSLAIMNDGCEVTTIEGLAKDGRLHPMQAAFIEHDALQYGYCTPGQICSAVGMLKEAKAGAPSAATANISQIQAIDLTDDEIRERMSGNICRCGAYVGIVAAIRSIERGTSA